MDIVYFLAGFGILAGIYAVFTLGLNVHWGYTGLFNIGVAGFFALGAYTSALLTTAPPSPLLFEDFLFGGNLANTAEAWGSIYGSSWRLSCAAAVVSGIVALVVGGDYPATARRLPRHINARHRRERPPDVPQREVACQRLARAVQHPQVPRRQGFAGPV